MVIGHIIGLVIPQSWTEAVNISESAYHVQALILGGIAGIATLTGVTILIYRRRTTGPVFMATTKNDKTMYVVLVSALATGLATTLIGSGVVADEHNYRETVSPWFRSIFTLTPEIDAIAAAPLSFQIHTLVGHAALRDLAVHPTRTRLQRADRVPVPPIHRLSESRCCNAALAGRPIMTAVDRSA